MAQIKISELTRLGELEDNDVLAGVDTSAKETKKVPMDVLKNYVLGGIDLSNYYTKEQTNTAIKNYVDSLDSDEVAY